jgi:hypothetical protein
MSMSDYEKGKFRFSETFNNSDGKTSGSGFVGVLAGLVASLMIVGGTFGYFFQLEDTMEFLGVAVKIFGFSIALLGARKIAGQIWKDKPEKPEEPTSPPSTLNEGEHHSERG